MNPQRWILVLLLVTAAAKCDKFQDRVTEGPQVVGQLLMGHLPMGLMVELLVLFLGPPHSGGGLIHRTHRHIF